MIERLIFYNFVNMKLSFIKKNVMILGCITIFLLFSDFTNSQENNEAIWLGRVKVSSLRIRSKPNINAKILGIVLWGHRIEILDETDKKDTINGITSSWYRVKTSKNIIGFMFGGYIEKADEKIPYRNPLSTVLPSQACSETDGNCEKELLSKFPDKVKREGTKLILKSSKGSVIFNDNDKVDLIHKVYQYYPELKIFILEVWSHREVNWFYIVNEINGNFASIVGKPIISPSKNRLVAVKDYGLTGYGNNKIQILNIENNHFTKEFEKIIDWHPCCPLWLNENKISIVRDDIGIAKNDRTGTVFQSQYSLIELEYVESKWILVE